MTKATEQQVLKLFGDDLPDDFYTYYLFYRKPYYIVRWENAEYYICNTEDEVNFIINKN